MKLSKTLRRWCLGLAAFGLVAAAANASAADLVMWERSGGNKDMVDRLVAMWHAKYGIVLAGQKVPMPSGNRVLQLWLIPKAPGGKPMPSMTVRPDANGNFVILVANPPAAGSDTKALAITEEPAGGSAAPTTTPKWVGAMS